MVGGEAPSKGVALRNLFRSGSLERQVSSGRRPSKHEY